MLFQMLKFGVTGGLATTIHASALILMVEVLHLEPVPASVPAFLLALLFSYLFNHCWTFGAVGSHVRYFSKYVVVSLAGFLMNLWIMISTVTLLGMAYQFGLALVVIVVPLLSFLLQRYWTFADV